MRLMLAVGTLVVLALSSLPFGSQAGVVAQDCPEIIDYQVEAPHGTGHGLLALPCDAEPHDLVVVTHGRNNNAESHRGHLLRAAAQGAIAVAMDGAGGNFAIRNGTDETKAALAGLLAAYPSVSNVIMVSISMGTATGGMVLAEITNVVDTWILAEPMANIIETYHEAVLAEPASSNVTDALREMRRECDGGFHDNPECYAERTAVLRVPETAGLSGAIVLHGLFDGVVPYNQGREVAAALRAHLVPTDFVTVLRGEPGGEGTTPFEYAGQPSPDGLAGHGSERDENATLTIATWEAVDMVLGGDPGDTPANREQVWDRELN